MKVYELMSELSKVESGEDVIISACVSSNDILGVERTDGGDFLVAFQIESVDGGIISVEIEK